MKKIAIRFLMTLAVLSAMLPLTSHAFNLRDFGQQVGANILQQQQQQAQQNRQQCIAQCDNDGTCMHGCAEGYPTQNQQQRVDIGCMTRCADAGSSYQFCQSRCGY